MAARASRSVQGRVEGVQDLLKRMQFLRDHKMVEKISNKGTFRASKEVKNAAIAIAYGKGLLESGALLRNIAMKKIKFGNGKIGFTVGVRAGTPKQIKRTKAGMKDDPFYWWFLEFGTIDIPAGKYSFLRPAWDQLRNRSPASIKADALEAISKAVDAALRKIPNRRG